MAEVVVLVEGIHKAVSDKVVSVGSTSTLIKSDRAVLVDPGAFVNQHQLIEALGREGLKITDIDSVVLTHLHLDHSTNVFLFPQAKIFLRFINSNYPGQFQKLNEGTLERFDLSKDFSVEDVALIETPGHSIDHLSIVVKTQQGVVVIAGDAIPNIEWIDTQKKPNPDFVYSVEKFDESRNKILQLADFIIPGHGPMFKIDRTK
ncbi:MBL fold metallo-hydrolase [Patescibacteria group bacterium]|nr:MAG: MBL fold metallo-hydrolase [Patescibacteria group bacterium]